jgi:hypothetical protein
VRKILDGHDQQGKEGKLGAEYGKKLLEKDSLKTTKSHLGDPAHFLRRLKNDRES